MPDLTGKVAIVTGASSGIGKAAAEAMAQAGAKVVVTDVQDKLGEQVVHGIEQTGGEAVYVHCDVSQATDVEAMVETAIDTYGRLDIAVNNAGIEGEQASTHEQTEENWDRVVDINLKGVWRCMKAQIPHMLDEGGSIVNVASIAGLVGFEGVAPYDASKHGVIGLTQTAALEYAKQDIRVNAVCPGVIRTPMIDRFTGGDEAAEQGLAESEPVGRMGDPEEVADAIVYLASEEASFVTGNAMPVDGGWTAR